MNPRPYAEAERNKLLSLREKVWYLSSRFYEYIPHEEFRNKMVPPISNMNMVMEKSAMIQNLIQIEMASKILLGALYWAAPINMDMVEDAFSLKARMNPLEYCLRASGMDFEVLNTEDPEYRLLREYVNNTYYEGAN